MLLLMVSADLFQRGTRNYITGGMRRGNYTLWPTEIHNARQYSLGEREKLIYVSFKPDGE